MFDVPRFSVWFSLKTKHQKEPGCRLSVIVWMLVSAGDMTVMRMVMSVTSAMVTLISSFDICLNCAFVICLWCWHFGSLTAFSWRVVSGLHLGGDAGQPTTLPWQALYPSYVNCFRHKCAHVCMHTHTHTHTPTHTLLEEMLFQKCYSLYKQCLIWMTSEGEEKGKQWLGKEQIHSWITKLN